MFKSDNPLSRIELTLPALCCIGGVKGPQEIRPDHMPLPTEVESTVERNLKTNVSKVVTRYGLALPGSGLMRVIVKVEEDQPSISPETIAKCGGMVRVAIEGYSYGSFEVDSGGVRPYFKATRISPIQTQPNR